MINPVGGLRLIDDKMFENPGGNAEFNEYLSYFLDQDRLKGKRKILIVEDDALSAIHLKTLIKDYDDNIVVFVASHPQEALQILRNQTCDLVITDYYLSQKENGLDLWNRVSQEFPHLEGMVVSGIERNKFLDLARFSMNPPLFCQKPVSQSRMKQFLNFLIGGRHS